MNSLSKPKITNITIDHVESTGFAIDSVKYEIVKFDVKDVVNYNFNIQDNTMSITCKTKIEPDGKEN